MSDIKKINVKGTVYDLVDAGARQLIENLPKPMIFKGTVGAGGTVEWANFPPEGAQEGWTYKVITDHATEPVCKTGDVVIYNGTAWVVVPAGDEPSGTVTNVATGSGLTGGPITTSGTISVDFDTVQAKLPTAVNGKYLHANNDTGALEWSEVAAGGVVEVNELPALAEADKGVIYRVPEKTETKTVWAGTTVPNSGTLSALYGNVEYNPLELVDTLDWFSDTGFKGYMILSNSDGSNQLFMGYELSGGDFIIQADVSGSEDPTILYIGNINSGTGSWQMTQAELNNFLSVYIGTTLVNSVYGYSVGADNETINGLFSLTQPTSTVIPGQILSYKYYNASATEYTNLNNPISKISATDAVPNEGNVVIDVIFDTSMTQAQVDAELAKVTYIEDYGIYYALLDSTYSAGVMFSKEDSSYSIMTTDDTIYTTEDGWDPSFTGTLHVNGTLLSEISGRGGVHPVGQENSKIIPLMYVGSEKYVIKNFDGSTEDLITELTVNGKNVIQTNKVALEIGEKVELFGGPAKAVPNSGNGAKYQFETSLTTSEVDAILGTLTEWTGDEEEQESIIVASSSGDQYCAVVRTKPSGETNYTYSITQDSEIYSTTNGWTTGFNGIIDYSDTTLVSDIEGISVGKENNKLVNLFHTLAQSYSYGVFDPDGEKHNFAEVKDPVAILGTNTDIESVGGIAVGYRTPTYDVTTWDGETTGKTVKIYSPPDTTSSYAFYKISNKIFTSAELENAIVTCVDDSGEVFPVESQTVSEDTANNIHSCSIWCGRGVMVYLLSVYGTSSTFSETGLYCTKLLDSWASEIKVQNGYTYHKITSEYLDVTIPEVSDMIGATASTDGAHGLAPKPVAGDQNKFLRGDATWATVDALPSQSGQAGKFLTTNGTTASWSTPGDFPVISSATGTIPSGSTTSVTVTFTGGYISSYVTDSTGNLVTVETQIISGGVVFTASTAPSEALTCKVMYVANNVQDVNGEEF